MVFFWAGEVSEAKAAVVKVPAGFVLNVCNATLAIAPGAAADVVSLGLETAQMDQKAWKGVVAHLGGATHQVKLDLVFGGVPQVKFYVAKGSGKVNLTGYFQPGPPTDLLEGEEQPTATSTKSSNKKRAREEVVTWDQTPSDSEDETAKAVAPVQKKQDNKKPQQQKQQKKAEQPKQQQQQPKKPEQPKQQKQQEKKAEQQEKKTEQPKSAPTANGTASTPAEGGSSKKKHRKQKKKNGGGGDKAAN